MREIISTVLIIVAVCAAQVTAAQAQCMNLTKGLLSMHQEQIILVNDLGQQVPLQVLVADENYERASGFQHICPKVIDEILIMFRYEAESTGRFHMQNVHAPLDIAFFNADGVLVNSMLMQTYTEEFKPLYDPGTPFKFALEARQGFFSEIDVSAARSYLVIGN